MRHPLESTCTRVGGAIEHRHGTPTQYNDHHTNEEESLVSTIIGIIEFGVGIGIAYAVAFGIYQAIATIASKIRGRRKHHFPQVYVRGYGKVDAGSQYLIAWLLSRGLEVIEHSSCGPTGRTVHVRGRRRRPPVRGYVFVAGPRQVLAGLIDELAYLASFSDEHLAAHLRATEVFDDGPGWNDDASPHFSAIYVAGQEQRTGRRYFSVELRYGPADLERLNRMLRSEVRPVPARSSAGAK